MKHEDRPDFCDLMTAVGEYYGREISDGLLSMYWQGLERFEIGSLREALNRHIQNPDSGQFMPKISDIVRMLQGSTQDSALIAWAKVDRAVRTVGTYESVVFDDSVIHRVISDMGGWVNIGNKTEDDWPFVAREFENRYRGYVSRSESPEYPPVMVGMAEAQNNTMGFKSQPPRLIGNPEAARRVYLHGSNVVDLVQRLGDSTAQVADKLIGIAKARNG